LGHLFAKFLEEAWRWRHGSRGGAATAEDDAATAQRNRHGTQYKGPCLSLGNHESVRLLQEHRRKASVTDGGGRRREERQGGAESSYELAPCTSDSVAARSPPPGPPPGIFEWECWRHVFGLRNGDTVIWMRGAPCQPGCRGRRWCGSHCRGWPSAPDPRICVRLRPPR